jgi:iron complex transport system ATP-binding protein
MNTTIEARELTCGYGRRRVLEALSLAARPGEVLVLMGPNGAGKTTLLRALARLLPPDSGQVLLGDRDVWSLSAQSLARDVALMPQSERREWPLSVEECVRLGRTPHRGWVLPFSHEDRRIVETALEAAGLDGLRTRPVTELSGGEWRRMILARALAQQARVLLLDEPTAGLDLKYQVDVLRLVRNMAAEHQLVVVLTLHDLNLAALYGDRLALLSAPRGSGSDLPQRLPDSNGAVAPGEPPVADHALVALGRPEEVLSAERITQVYGVPVTVMRHPVYQTPMVVPLLEEASTVATPRPGREA